MADIGSDEKIREMNSKLAAHDGFTAEEEFDGREAIHDEEKAGGTPDSQDEEIREMNARFAAQQGFVEEEQFDEREAEHDA